MIGRTIAHYHVLEQLGRGGMGIVYKVEDTKLKRMVALKFLPQELTDDPLCRERFIREAQAASALEHENICTIHDINETDDGQIFIVMAYYDGQSLRDIIKHGPLGNQEVLDISEQIVQGLAVAHKKNIIHRDIKSGNIMVTTDGKAKIIDFGLAKLKGQPNLTKTSTTIGTVAYMSPEQTIGEPVDHRTDVWAFGVVLYEMVTGVLPFQAKYDQAVIYSILNEDPAPMSEITSEFHQKINHTILRTLSKDPAQRFQTMDDLLDQLRDIRDRGSNADRVTWQAPKELHSDTCPIRSLVVLPLANYSNDPEQEYFVDGMTDALTTYLSKLPSLKVISRTSAMRYKKTKKSIPEIAAELKVDALLEGSVIRSGNRIRVTAQLIQAETDSHLWAENYERNFEDVILLQSEISQSIANEIKLKLSKGDEKRLRAASIINPESYDAYLRGLFHFYKVSPDHIQTAMNYFILALEKDPGCALAYVGVAYVWLARSYWGMAVPREVMPQAKESTMKAISLDDTLDEAYKVLATIMNNFDWDWIAAEQAYQRALELNPNNADARLFYASFLRSMRRGEEAMEQSKRGLESDPFNPFAQSCYVGQLLYQHQYDEAISRLRGIVGSEPRLSLAHRFLWIAYLQKKMYREAIEEVRKFFFTLGKNEFADLVEKGSSQDDYIRNMVRLAEKLETRFQTAYIQPVWIARLNAHAGNKKKALRWLEQAYEDRDPIMANLNTSFDWENLRSEPRFKKLLEKMNLLE